jgi:pyruvate ferredoxin oxidoreductase gamma subunit
MLEVRLHGRGGQGAVTSAELLAIAAIGRGAYAQAFPSFGPERRGAPVVAFLRISDRPIKLRCNIMEPDMVMVLDPGILKIVPVAAGLKPEGVLVANSRLEPDQIREITSHKGKIVQVDATKVATEELGIPVTNTTMIGALLRGRELVRLEDLEEPLRHRFGRLAEKNFRAMKRAFEEAIVSE